MFFSFLNTFEKVNVPFMNFYAALIVLFLDIGIMRRSCMRHFLIITGAGILNSSIYRLYNVLNLSSLSYIARAFAMLYETIKTTGFINYVSVSPNRSFYF